jgi:hypothetical protein
MDSSIVVHRAGRIVATLAIVVLVSGLSGVGIYGAGNALGALAHSSPLTLGPNDHTVLSPPAGGSASISAAHAPSVGPLLVLSPTEAAVGAMVYANGTGFAHNASINVTWTGLPAVLCPPKTTDSKATGAFSCLFTVPAETNGTYTITAKDNASTPDVGTATFTLISNITLTAYAGGPGTPIGVTGTGFGATSTWHVSWSGTPAIACLGSKAKTDTLGDFSCSFVITPAAAGAAYVVSASDSATPAHNATAQLTVPTPAIVLNDTTTFAANGNVSDPLIITGVGFAGSNATITNAVTATWGPEGWVLCNVATTASGTFSCTTAVPDGSAGPHLVVATDQYANTGGLAFTVVPQIVLSPTSALAGTNVTVTGTGFAALATATVTWAPGAVKVCAVDTSATGDLTGCVFPVPAGAALGAHVVTATDAATNSATATFTVPPTPPTVSVAFTTPFTLYMPTPLTLAWTITANAPVNIETTNMWLVVEDLGSTACPYIEFNGLKQGVGVQNTPCPVVDLPLDSLLVNNTDSYTYTLTVANMTIQNYNSGTLPYATEYSVAVYVNMSTSPYVNGTTTGSVGQGGSTQDIYLQTYLPTVTLVSPLANVGISTGNVSIVVSYSGDFVSGATVDIYLGTSTGQLVYSAGVAQAGIGPHVGSAAADWRPTLPGTYTAVVNLSGPYGYSLTSFPLTVVPAGTNVYVNTSSYHNSSLIGGLSAGASATLFLVIGLIVGMVVALLLARMVWGGTPSTKPPEPWAAKPAEKTPPDQANLKANECPVCHQQFGSAAELAEHQKKDHGSSAPSMPST